MRALGSKKQTDINDFLNDLKKKIDTQEKKKEENITNKNNKNEVKKRFRDLTDYMFNDNPKEEKNETKTEIIEEKTSGTVLLQEIKVEEMIDKDKNKIINKEDKNYDIINKNSGEINSWWLNEEDKYYNSVSGYLLEVRYDGEIGKAVALIYDTNDKKIKKWIDKTGHKPYLLTDMRPDENSRQTLDLSKFKSFSNYAYVIKKNPLTNTDLRLTKIIMEDPLSVKNVRIALKEKGFNAWEADIKYFLNYIYDNQLIPGMPYEVNDRWVRKNVEIDKSMSELVEKSFQDSTKELAYLWLPVLEEKAPDIERVAIDIEVYTPQGKFPNADEAYYPIISISLADNKNNRQVLILNRFGSKIKGKLPNAEIEIFDTEKALILETLRRLSKYSVIVTFNGDNFDIPYIYNRLIELGVDPRDIPIIFHQDYITFQNSLHLDLHKLFDIKALQTYAFSNKYREKSLDAVAESLLGSSKLKLSDNINDINIDELASYNLQDAILTISLTTFSNNLVWNLLMLIMRISKMGLEEVSRTQVSAWIKSTLYWEHRRRNLLIPNKEDISKGNDKTRSTAIIKDKKYRGAIVLSPPQGVYFNVLVLDFASLYPSIIKNWNLSYETVNIRNCNGETIQVPEVGHVICKERKGISSELVGLLRDFRVNIYKKKSKDKKLSNQERMWYDTVQAAMKVYINASYGVFGTETFSLYSLPVAESVTAIGRNILRDTLNKSKELNLHILYGDTDSLFLWDPQKEKLEEIIKYVKDKYELDLEIDKKFKIVLFSGLKKNYIGIDDSNSVTIKGLIAKKSNTPEFIKLEFQNAINILQKLNSPEEVEKTLNQLKDLIQEIYQKLRKKEYTLDQLAITVMLSKDLREYERNTPQHVKAALLMKKEGFNIAKGDVISFIKTKDKLSVKPVRLAKLSEVDTSKYVEYIRSALEQFLLAFGVQWDELIGIKKLF
ncbi:DNA polymerase elongation subunit (family B) [Caldisphaera lagunensis DSM 15908]|uniref:DNA polymerase n=1 Tax=Caldisphaera lagunensis (strain DSM 15908 / JCM 11604 / ANMR 0165 / IC-154) TaxID=1056495 RepID=L0ACP6_CALLD|nr:DNA-directed DNA polymerase I [Caldisphaera lagunensis]AFZ70830.1 DNA polymerase elongation subunit (family B) [Caldisphaera lagunensis DSM 15908]